MGHMPGGIERGLFLQLPRLKSDRGRRTSRLGNGARDTVASMPSGLRTPRGTRLPLRFQSVW
eukprot:9298052-Alexandrium_andersonii.AAC.1